MGGAEEGREGGGGGRREGEREGGGGGGGGRERGWGYHFCISSYGSVECTFTVKLNVK